MMAILVSVVPHTANESWQCSIRYKESGLSSHWVADIIERQGWFRPGKAGFLVDRPQHTRHLP